MTGTWASAALTEPCFIATTLRGHVPIFRRETRGSETHSDLPTATELVTGRARVDPRSLTRPPAASTRSSCRHEQDTLSGRRSCALCVMRSQGAVGAQSTSLAPPQIHPCISLPPDSTAAPAGVRGVPGPGCPKLWEALWVALWINLLPEATLTEMASPG